MTSTGTTTQAPPAGTAAVNGSWYPHNLALIRDRLDRVAAAAPSPRPVAVFDFDNTCIFRDVGQAVFRFQLLNLRYRITPEQLAAILPTGAGELGDRPLRSVVAALLASYQTLWPLIGAQDVSRARQLPEYRLFTCLLLWFLSHARRDERLGPRYVLPLMAKMLAGYTPAELRQLAREVVKAVRSEPLVMEQLEVEAPEPIGRIRASYPLGLHAQPEMQELMAQLGQRNIDCFVVSASAEWLVEGAAELLGFPVPAEHVFGIRVGLDGGGVLTTADPDGYPLTFREGKAEIIARYIGGRPVLVAGDADTDFEMLTLPGVEIRLLINRNLQGLIARLYQDPQILLQGLDLHTGRFRPFRESIGA